MFLWDGKIERRLNAVEGVPEMLRRQGFHATTVVLSAWWRVANAAERRALRLADGATVFQLR